MVRRFPKRIIHLDKRERREEAQESYLVQRFEREVNRLLAVETIEYIF